MPTLAQIKQYLSLTVVPVLAGAAADWLVVHVHFLASFHLTAHSIALGLTQLGVFGVAAGLAFLASHHILKGSYPSPTRSVLGEATLGLKPVLAHGIASSPAPVVVNVNATPSPTVAADGPAPAPPPAA